MPNNGTISGNKFPNADGILFVRMTIYSGEIQCLFNFIKCYTKHYNLLTILLFNEMDVKHT